MTSRKDLQDKYNITSRTLKQSLLACGLKSDQDDYSEQEVQKLDEVRRLVSEQSMTYQQVAQKMEGKVLKSAPKAQPQALPAAPSESGDAVGASPPALLDIPALQVRSQSRGFALEFGDLIELVEACGGTADDEGLEQAMVERFDLALDLLQQGKTLAQVRQQFGLGGEVSERLTLPQLVQRSLEDGYKIGYGSAVAVIRQLGLDPNLKSYESAQVQTVLAGFKLKVEGAPIEELRLLNLNDGYITAEQLYEQYSQAGETSSLLQTFQDLADAQAARMGPLVTRIQLASVLREVSEGDGSKKVMSDFRDYALARMQGKSPEQASQSLLGTSPTSRLLRE